MNLKKAFHQSTSYLKRQSPTILACVGAAGVVTTAVMAVRATPKAMRILEVATDEKGEDLTKLEIVKLAGPSYIPSIAFGVSTIACIFGANVLNKQQQAAITSAYIFLDKTYKEYKNKVAELFGEDANDRIRESIAKDKYDDEEEHKIEGDVCIFYEEHFGKFFERTRLEVREAEYELNRLFVTMGEVSLNDFYELLELPKIDDGELYGWSQESICDFYNPAWLEFEHNLVKMDDGMECYIIDYLVPPTLNYNIPF